MVFRYGSVSLLKAQTEVWISMKSTDFHWNRDVSPLRPHLDLAVLCVFQWIYAWIHRFTLWNPRISSKLSYIGLLQLALNLPISEIYTKKIKHMFTCIGCNQIKFKCLKCRSAEAEPRVLSESYDILGSGFRLSFFIIRLTFNIICIQLFHEIVHTCNSVHINTRMKFVG